MYYQNNLASTIQYVANDNLAEIVLFVVLFVTVTDSNERVS